jgi:hypothetical protein
MALGLHILDSATNWQAIVLPHKGLQSTAVMPGDGAASSNCERCGLTGLQRLLDRPLPRAMAGFLIDDGPR